MQRIAERLRGQLSRAAARMSWRGLSTFIAQNLKPFGTQSVVLNVGAGGRTGALIDQIRAEQNFELVSIDIDPSRRPDCVADVTTYDPEARFDAVLMIEVIEHVKDPFGAIANVHRLLKPGGRLILSAPFLFPLHDRPHDYFRFTRYGLAMLLTMFANAEIKERDSWAENMCVLWARMYREYPTVGTMLGTLFVVGAIVTYPFAALLVRIVPIDAYTTGYTAVATK